MLLKNYQIRVNKALQNFFTQAEAQKNIVEKLDDNLKKSISYVDLTYKTLGFSHFSDRPTNGLGKDYARVCLKIPTGGGKTLLAVEAIRDYQNLFAKRNTGLVVWITHRETIYRQTIEKLKDKNHVYRQWLDQCSGNKTLILEKGQSLRLDDVQNNLTVLMLMIQSASRTTKENMKVFQDSGGYMDFFPPDHEYSKHKQLLEHTPNLDMLSDELTNQKIVKTSLANAIRLTRPLIIVDEFHTMFTDIAKETLDGLNPEMIIGLSATPKERRQMNIFIEVTGQELKSEDMIKLDLHLHSPTVSNNWHEMVNAIISKRDFLEREAIKYAGNKGVYIRPIALIQAERTGRDQRGSGFVHSEDVREYLLQKGISSYEIAVKSSEIDEIKEERLLSNACEVRYIITKEALKEGWDCSFAYVLGVIPNVRTESSLTQLVGRILRQPYARKTQIKALDESYVFFTKGDTEDVLKNIQKGFEQEGLGDLVKSIGKESGPKGSNTFTAKIKKSILKQYPESLYLPVWAVKQGSKYRRFSYDIDIKPKIDWDNFDYTIWLKALIFKLMDEKTIPFELLIDLEGHRKRMLEDDDSGMFEIQYLSRRLMDVIENAFIAHELAQRIVKECEKHKAVQKIRAHSGYITSEIVKKLRQEKNNQEQAIFESLLKDGQLILAVCESSDIGYMLPMHTEVYPEGVESFSQNLYERSDATSMTSLERRVAENIDNKKSVAWWTRNKAADKSWYSVRGWKEGRIFPDFIVAKKKKDGSLEVTYVIESKGEHLLGNPDTLYKKAIFKILTNSKIQIIKVGMVGLNLNTFFKFKFVDQGNEDADMNEFFN